jgi:hypothetical protein
MQHGARSSPSNHLAWEPDGTRCASHCQ